MSAKKLSRAFAQGEIKKLRRMKQPLVLKLEASGPPRNPVAAALAQRSLSSAAGKHIRTRGAQRRADNVALRKAIQSPFLNDWHESLQHPPAATPAASHPASGAGRSADARGAPPTRA